MCVPLNWKANNLILNFKKFKVDLLKEREPIFFFILFVYKSVGLYKNPLIQFVKQMDLTCYILCLILFLTEYVLFLMLFKFYLV